MTMKHAQRGAALIEFAIALPLLMMVLIGLIEFGRVAYFTIQIGNAAHAGAQYGSRNISAGGDVAGMKAAAIADGQNTIANMTAADIVAQNVCTCWTGSAEIPNPPSASVCRQNCVAGRQITYAQVTVTGTIHPLFNLGALGLPSQWVVSRTATIQVMQ